MPLCAALLAAALLPTATLAGSLEWRVVSGWGLERQVERLVEVGFEIEAVVTHAPEVTLLLGRPCCGKRPAVASYQLVSRTGAARVAELGEQGYRLRSFATDRVGIGLAVFERRNGDTESGHEYRSVVGDLPTVDAELETLAAAGFRPVAATGRTPSHPDWVLLVRGAGDAPRELRVIDVDSSQALEEALVDAAREGYAVDTAWSRTNKRFPLLGPERLAAIASRPRGESRPVPHARVAVGSEPESSAGRPIAATIWRARIAFVQRDDSRPYHMVRELGWPQEDTPAWQRWSAVERELDRYQGRSIGHAWVVWDAGVPVQLYVLDRDDDQYAEPARASAEVPPLPIPEGAESLGADGGAPWAAYGELLSRIRSGDLAGTKERWTGEAAAEWAERVASAKAYTRFGPSEKDLFEGLEHQFPVDPRLIGGWQHGDQAMLRVEGTILGGRRWSDIGVVYEGGMWKVSTWAGWYGL